MLGWQSSAEPGRCIGQVAPISEAPQPVKIAIRGPGTPKQGVRPCLSLYRGVLRPKQQLGLPLLFVAVLYTASWVMHPGDSFLGLK